MQGLAGHGVNDPFGHAQRSCPRLRKSSITTIQENVMRSSDLGTCLIGAVVGLGSGAATAGGYGYYYGHPGDQTRGQQAPVYHAGQTRPGRVLGLVNTV